MAVKHPSETRLDKDNTKASTTAPGDGPADTTDPEEFASTVGGDKKAAALAGFGTVNAVVPLPRRDAAPREAGKDRVEKYQATAPDGSTVTVTHNIDTGETSVA
jgi:hypothetical protein